jgi:hypothetical protein
MLSRRLVFVIAVTGAVGGENVVPLGYKQVPFTSLKFDMYPKKYQTAASPARATIKLEAELFRVAPATATVPY